MTVEQVAINDRAIREQADRLTATGWDGDAHRFVESLLLAAIGAGYRRIEPPPPPRGPGGSPAARAAARQAAQEAVQAAKDRRQGATP